MKKIKIILGILTLLSITTVFGQQDAQYTQYMYNMNVINPAYAGSKGITSLGLLGRTQWVGLDGAPKTFTLSLHSPVGKAVGLGLSIINDEIGPVKENNIYVDFSYTIITSDEGRLAFGLKGGISFLDVRNLITNDSDPLNIPIHKTSPNFGAGLYYYTNKFYLGFSAPNFLETRHLEKGGGVVSSATEKMHYFLTSGYVFDLSENLKLKPSTMIKATSGAPISVDISGNLLFNEKFEIGLSYRFDDSISAMVGFNINEDFRIGYAYDYTTSNFGDYNSGSHEIMLLFDFNRRNLKSPRFF
ncbi:type IX secretion system membrane protein PorP/SprF [Lutibacter sp.]|uniref:PorP/SprF family type IX secretion system membrane protein n=1 Tax=Lutibacter sp. TaxID=1925666 RepID=UPI0025BDCE58|nr:type IX secretion system membrane protein PorP/SprF [Lutibacter sp.]MCF6182501.1 type IX secretion system membrane protein PorP/SprF [Lutibacter sp.]